MPTLCSFKLQSGRGTYSVRRDDENDDIVVDLLLNNAEPNEFLRSNYQEECSAVIMDLAREITRLQAEVKGK